MTASARNFLIAWSRRDYHVKKIEVVGSGCLWLSE